MRPLDSPITTQAPAKLNLYLEVLGRRPDGYHEIETVMQTVALHDELTFTPTDGTIDLVCDHPSLDAGAGNLVVAAAELLKRTTGIQAGVHMSLVKRIPIGAGLGGGSSEGAGALLTLNRVWGTGLSQAALTELAGQLGADVPFFLVGGTALCRGRGERVSPILGVRQIDYVVVCPSVEVSTRRVYENVPSDLTSVPFGTKVFLQELTRRQGGGGRMRLFNRLEEVTLRVYPQLRRVADLMRRAGCEQVSMTGSGSAFFAACASRKEAALVADRLTNEDIGAVFEVTNNVSSSEEFG